MKAPIASPWPEPELTREMEWDDISQCFRFRTVSSFKGRVRCEMKTCRFKPGNILVVTLMFPLFVLILLVTQYGFGKRITTIQVHEWGLSIITPEMSKNLTWASIQDVVLWNGDIFYVLSGSMCGFSARECFSREDEPQKFYALVHNLWQHQGATWAQIKAQKMA